jgi:primosomal protein N' (replication factor Y)
MKYHKVDAAMKCHYCGAVRVIPERCPDCGSRALRAMGIGTEKVHSQLQRFFKDARVDRMDSDTTTRKGEYSRIIHDFEKGAIDVLVGTQMIAKGFDFPGMINMPDFRSSERTFQLLTQVAGRAGRRRAPGRAIVQTYAPLHPAVTAARSHNYEEFFNYEIEVRRKAKFPPFTLLVNFIITAADQREVRDVALRFAETIKKIITGTETSHFLGIMGPAEAPFYKLHGKYRWFVGLRSTSFKLLLDTARQALADTPKKDSKIIHPDVFPENMM